MKKIIRGLVPAPPIIAFSQIGVKAGPDFANVTNTSSITHNSDTGNNNE